MGWGFYSRVLYQHAAPGMRQAWNYAKVELKPPSTRDMPEISAGFARLANAAKTNKWRNLTVREAWLNTLVGVEIAMWFFIGEIIGKRHFVGYYIKP